MQVKGLVEIRMRNKRAQCGGIETQATNTSSAQRRRLHLLQEVQFHRGRCWSDVKAYIARTASGRCAAVIDRLAYIALASDRARGSKGG
jgi:hypothetical protein